MATIKYQYPRGEEHHFARCTETQVAHANRLLMDASRVEVLASGELDRIAEETGVPIAGLRHIHSGARWKHVKSAPATEESR